MILLTTGRCYSGEYKSRRIVYPDRAEYIGHDVRTGSVSVDGTIEMDLVYLSCERDVDREEKEDEESE